VIAEDQPAAEYLRLFASADVCLAPSRWEGLGLHLFEATAFGMPVITNDNPPMNEVVRDGENGLLAGSLDEWRDQMSRVIADGALRQRVARAGYETVAGRYTVDRVGPLLAGGLRRARCEPVQP
jgi:glycosyltransferase involved in cell wall biosynthesis